MGRAVILQNVGQCLNNGYKIELLSGACLFAQ